MVHDDTVMPIGHLEHRGVTRRCQDQLAVYTRKGPSSTLECSSPDLLFFQRIGSLAASHSILSTLTLTALSVRGLGTCTTMAPGVMDAETDTLPSAPSRLC